ncbi:MAG TPA: PPC domain-containing DNA-binding protein [Opitutus sp.]|nr:PPC domain-containing DNA-binding protein [Opitutus sp.]
MKTKPLTSDGGQTFALIFETGDEVVAGLTDFAVRHELRAAHFTAIGAFREAVLAYFDWEKKDYVKIPVQEQVEVLVLTGDIALKDGQPVVHAHVVVGRRDGTTRGGHLISAHVRPTLEVILATGGALQKRHDAESGLALIAAD